MRGGAMHTAILSVVLLLTASAAGAQTSMPRMVSVTCAIRRWRQLCLCCVTG